MVVPSAAETEEQVHSLWASVVQMNAPLFFTQAVKLVTAFKSNWA